MKGFALNVRVEIYFLPAPRSKGAKVLCITPKWNGLPEVLLQLEMLKADVGGVSSGSRCQDGRFRGEPLVCGGDGVEGPV